MVRRRRNRITGMWVESTWCTEEATLQREALAYFRNIFIANHSGQSCPLLPHQLPTIDEHLHASLLNRVTRHEVFLAVHSMKPLKAPGKDGFQPIFFQEYEDVVLDDLQSMVDEAFTAGGIDPILAETLVVLIPKVDAPTMFKELRPISLCNVVYKVITKVIVQRIRPLLDNIVSPLQNSFVPGRGANENVLIAQEVIHHIRKSKSKENSIVVKIDLEKAYDRVNWDFLRDILVEFNFPTRLVDLIMSCVSSCTLSLLWNGSMLQEFHPNRGLRQGDPLSPYLFILCMEKLGAMIQDRVGDGSWAAIRMSKEGPALSHLFFADDCLLFTKAKGKYIRVVSEVLERFCAISGLKINLDKSKFFCSAGLSQRKRDKITSACGIRYTSNLGRYLGFPLTHGRVTKQDFQFLLEKVQKRLAGWKSLLLSKPGRVTLAKSVLSSIPTYCMQAAWLPEGICDSIDSMVRQFVWGKGGDQKGVHLVPWHITSRPRKNGGLGLRRTRWANVSLLGKLAWSLLHQKHKLWVRVLEAKYLHHRHLFEVASKPTDSFTWKSITKTVAVLKGGFKFSFEEGHNSFWFDTWLPEGPLCNLVGFVNTRDEHLRVCDVWQDGSWNIQELHTLIPNTLMVLLESSPPSLSSTGMNNFYWAPSTDGIYSPKSAYLWLCLANLGHDLWDWNWIWNCRCTEAIRFFLWQISHDALPTCVLLHRRHMKDTGLCPRCGLADESIIHCLRDCIQPREVWCALGHTLDTRFWSLDIRSWIKGYYSRSSSFLTTLWWIWRGRNQEVFEHTLWPSEVLLSKAKLLTLLMSRVLTRPRQLQGRHS